MDLGGSAIEAFTFAFAFRSRRALFFFFEETPSEHSRRFEDSEATAVEKGNFETRAEKDLNGK